MSNGAGLPAYPSFLEQTLAQANELVQAVRTDATGIAGAIDKSEANFLTGKLDKGLERLRWFVYPHETALILSADSVAEQDVSVGPLLGAVRPLQSSRSRDANECGQEELHENDKCDLAIASCVVL